MFKSYKEYKPSNMTWTKLLPINWEEKRISTFFCYKNDNVGNKWKKTQLLSLTKNGIIKNEKSSLIRLLRNAILPNSAPANLLIVAPAKLYHPNPLAIAVAWPTEILNIAAQSSPPKSEPSIIPTGIMKILT